MESNDYYGIMIELTSAILALIANTKFDLMIAIFIAIPVNILINVNNLLNGNLMRPSYIWLKHFLPVEIL